MFAFGDLHQTLRPNPHLRRSVRAPSGRPSRWPKPQSSSSQRRDALSAQPKEKRAVRGLIFGVFGVAILVSIN